MRVACGVCVQLWWNEPNARGRWTPLSGEGMTGVWRVHTVHTMAVQARTHTRAGAKTHTVAAQALTHTYMYTYTRVAGIVL